MNETLKSNSLTESEKSFINNAILKRMKLPLTNMSEENIERVDYKVLYNKNK